MREPASMNPIHKGHVCVVVTRHTFTPVRGPSECYDTFRVCIVASANVRGFAIKVADAASGSVREVSSVNDKVYAARGVTADAARALFSGRSDAVVDSLDEAKALLRPLRAVAEGVQS